MNKFLIALGFLCSYCVTINAQVGVGTTTPHESAALDVSSTTKGFVMPRMSTAQRTAIANPVESLTVFDTDTKTFWSYVVGTWIQATPGVGKFIDGATPDIAYYEDKVGIGINQFGNPHKLYVQAIREDSNPNTTVRVDAFYNGTGTNTTTYGIGAVARNNSTGTIGHAIGSQGIAQNPSGTISTAVGSWPQLSNHANVTWGSGIVADVSNFSGGVIGTGRAENLAVYNHSGATMGTASISSMYMENTGIVTGDGYGLWIGGNSTGSVGGNVYALYIATPFTNVTGNNYAFYSANVANSYFAGNVGIGTTDPQQLVHISGVMRLEPQGTAPTGAGQGDIYAGTDGKLYFHDGTNWRALAFE